jgi:hypothetical protein
MILIFTFFFFSFFLLVESAITGVTTGLMYQPWMTINDYGCRAIVELLAGENKVLGESLL